LKERREFWIQTIVIHSTLDYSEILGSILVEHLKFQEAEATFRRAVESDEKINGLGQVEALLSTYNLGLVPYSQERFMEVKVILRLGFEESERKIWRE
jgi:hypothetical protein